MQETVHTDLAVSWLLQSEDPSVRYLTLTEVLDKPHDLPDVESARKQIAQGPKVRVLLSGQRRDGGFGVHPYQKWTGAHWRLVSLVELGIPPGFKPAVRATDLVLKWLLGDAHLQNVPKIDGRYRRCASQEGNALAVCSRLGIANDPRVKQLAESLIEWQWPDGGWNCDRKEDVHHSSFNESLSTLWGLVEYAKSTGDDPASDAAKKAAEFFLRPNSSSSIESSGHAGPIRYDLPRPSTPESIIAFSSIRSLTFITHYTGIMISSKLSPYFRERAS